MERDTLLNRLPSLFAPVLPCEPVLLLLLTLRFSPCECEELGVSTSLE